MNQFFRDYVPDEKSYWHFHEPSGVLLYNNAEYGWVAVTGLEQVGRELEELETAITEARERGGIVTTSDVNERLVRYMGRCEDGASDKLD